MENWPDEDLGRDISGLGVAAVFLYILFLICLTVGLELPS